MAKLPFCLNLRGSRGPRAESASEKSTVDSGGTTYCLTDPHGKSDLAV